MAKPTKKANQLHQQLLSRLIETKPESWNRKVWDDDKKDVVNVKVTHNALRYPLAQNISDQSLEQAAKRWM